MRGMLINDARQPVAEMSYDPESPCAPLADGSPSIIPLVNGPLPKYDQYTEKLVPAGGVQDGKWVRGWSAVPLMGQEAKNGIMSKLSATDAGITRGIDDLAQLVAALGHDLPPSLKAKLDERAALRAQLASMGA